MVSGATICLYRLHHTAVAAAAPVIISRGTIYLCRLRHTAVAAAASTMIFRVFRRSTVAVIAIVRNRSYDATAAAAVQHCRRSSSQPHAPSPALSGTRGRTTATVQRRSSSQAPAPSSFVRGQRYNGGHSTVPPQHKYCGSNNDHGTNEGPQQQSDAAPMVARGTVRHFRNSSHASAPSVALAGRRGAFAAMDRR